MAYKVGLISLGCPKNQVDAEAMLASLDAAGFERYMERFRAGLETERTAVRYL